MQILISRIDFKKLRNTANTNLKIADIYHMIIMSLIRVEDFDCPCKIAPPLRD